MEMTEETKLAVYALKKFALDKTRRLQFATQDRERINKMIRAKMKPEGPRVDFVSSGAYSLIETMRNLGFVYNAQNPHDVCTMGDFIDILLEANRILMDKSRN